MIKRLLNIYQRYAARRMFSRWSPIYELQVTDNAYSAADKVAEASIRHIAALDKTNPQIADIGIGTGLLAQQIYDAMPCRITGLDFTEDMMAVCAGRDITELLIKCDVGKDVWPLQNTSFEAVLSSGLLEYLTEDMAQHFINESARVLQQNGVLVFTYIPLKTGDKKVNLWHGHSGTYLTCAYEPNVLENYLKRSNFILLEHSAPFKGCIFADGSSYDYRLIVAKKV